MSGWAPVGSTEPHWVPLGTVQGPPGETLVVLPYTMSGALVEKTGAAPLPIMGGPYEILDVAAMVGSGPIGSPVVLDVNVNGVSIYDDPADQPTIAPGTTAAVAGAPALDEVGDGDAFTVDVDQPGSVPGANLTVVVRLRLLPPTIP